MPWQKSLDSPIVDSMPTGGIQSLGINLPVIGTGLCIISYFGMFITVRLACLIFRVSLPAWSLSSYRLVFMNSSCYAFSAVSGDIYWFSRCPNFHSSRWVALVSCATASLLGIYSFGWAFLQGLVCSAVYTWSSSTLLLFYLWQYQINPFLYFGMTPRLGVLHSEVTESFGHSKVLLVLHSNIQHSHLSNHYQPSWHLIRLAHAALLA